MTAEIIDGKAIAESLRNRLAEKIAGWQVKLIWRLFWSAATGQYHLRPQQTKGGARRWAWPATFTICRRKPREADLLELIGRLNNERKVNGILVQMPLPKHINAAKVIETIAHEKDVDGFGRITPGCCTKTIRGQWWPPRRKAFFICWSIPSAT